MPKENAIDSDRERSDHRMGRCMAGPLEALSKHAERGPSVTHRVLSRLSRLGFSVRLRNHPAMH